MDWRWAAAGGGGGILCRHAHSLFHWLCFDEFLIWNVHQPNESVYINVLILFLRLILGKNIFVASRRLVCLLTTVSDRRRRRVSGRRDVMTSDVMDDTERDADDVWLDAALVSSSGDAEVAFLAPPRAPRIGAQLHTRAHSDYMAHGRL